MSGLKLSRLSQQGRASETLSVSDLIQKRVLAGENILNLAAGELPFRPNSDFIQCIKSQLQFSESFRYASVGGCNDLKDKLLNEFFFSREFLKETELRPQEVLDIMITNGSKQGIYATLGCLIDPGDKVALFTPYWVSFPEMVRYWKGDVVTIRTQAFDSFIPDLEELKTVLDQGIRAIMINSPNNPAGIHYPESWMKEFAALCLSYPDVAIISDELYDRVYYYDPKPRYFYEFEPALLERTVIINGISKSFCASGLRLGHILAPGPLIRTLEKVQSQTLSGANHLIQRGLAQFNFSLLEQNLAGVKNHLRRSSEILKDGLRGAGLAHCWYQTNSAFYFMLDFRRTPYFEKNFSESRDHDHSDQICREILEQTKIGLVPGQAFGLPNSARISFVAHLKMFEEGIKKLTSFLNQE
jgi:aspartate aminotransferase